MDDQGGAFGLIQIVLGALGLSGAGGGLLSAWIHWHSKRAEVAADERKAKAERYADLEAENRALRDQLLAAEVRREDDARAFRRAIRQRDDYVNVLRHGWATGAPPPPPPWPEGWVHY